MVWHELLRLYLLREGAAERLNVGRTCFLLRLLRQVLGGGPFLPRPFMLIFARASEPGTS